MIAINDELYLFQQNNNSLMNPLQELKSIQKDYSHLKNPYETVHHKPIRIEKDENSTLRKAQVLLHAVNRVY